MECLSHWPGNRAFSSNDCWIGTWRCRGQVRAGQEVAVASSGRILPWFTAMSAAFNEVTRHLEEEVLPFHAHMAVSPQLDESKRLGKILLA